MTQESNSIEPIRGQVRLDRLLPILESARRSGVDVDQLLLDIGVAHNIAAIAPHTHIDLIDYFRIQRRIGQSLDDLTSHLSERRLTYKTGTFLVSSIQEARTLQEAIQITCDYYNMLHGDDYNSLIVKDNLIRFRINDSKFPYRFGQEDELKLLVGDCLAIKTHCMLDSITNGRAASALRYVRLKRTRNIQDNPQNNYWNVPVKYAGSVYELAYDFEQACTVVPAAEKLDLSSDGILTRVITYLRSRSDNDRKRAYHVRVQEFILGGNINQASIANEMGVSVATLRRRLSEEGYTFRSILNQTTLDRADRMLRRGLSINQVSEALNYSDMRSFIRAYKKGKGLTPSAFQYSLFGNGSTTA